VEPIIAWVFSFIVAVAPPDRRHFSEGDRETKEEALARYESIARDLVDVVYSSKMKALFAGPDGRAKTAALVLSMMRFESDFRRDVDFGIAAGRGDHGRSFCLMQIQTGSGRTWPWNKVKQRFALDKDPPEEVEIGWTGEELLQDRKKCVTAGLRIAKMSFNACGSLPEVERLRVYASGSCGRGVKESVNRFALANRWYKDHPVPMQDAAVLARTSLDEGVPKVENVQANPLSPTRHVGYEPLLDSVH
jgi:hypothetical protein